jgi:hypothetical protein
MIDIDLMTASVMHVVRSRCDRRRRRRRSAECEVTRDRGAVSLEQVLWFVAAGVSVAVIATILWSQIREQANTPINTPTAP